jgi:two-component system sensor histidine kinase VicK
MKLDHPARHYFEAFTEGADQIFFAYDIASQKYSFLNPAFEKVGQKTCNNALGNSVALLKAIHPEDKQYVAQIYQELLDGTIIKGFEFRIVLRDRTER